MCRRSVIGQSKMQMSRPKETAVNAPYEYFNEPELEYQLKPRRLETTSDSRRQRRPEHARKSRPVGFNGIHRRRNKRYF